MELDTFIPFFRGFFGHQQFERAVKPVDAILDMIQERLEKRGSPRVGQHHSLYRLFKSRLKKK